MTTTETPKVKDNVAGVFTEFTVLRVVSEHKKARGVPRGMRRVMAVIKAGRCIETRHINVPK